MEEEIIHTDGNVTVTTSRIIISGTTYALRNITSVRLAKSEPSNGTPLALVMIGAMCGLIGLASLKEGAGAGAVVVLVGLGLLAGGIYRFRQLKPTFHIAIASAGGECHALSSYDESYISRIVQSVNDAIVRS